MFGDVVAAKDVNLTIEDKERRRVWSTLLSI